MIHLLLSGASGESSASAAGYAQIIAAVILIIGAVVIALQRIGMLPERKQTSEFASEVALWKERAERMESDAERLAAENARMSRTRSLEPVLEMLNRAAANQLAASEIAEQTLAKLASFNGTLAHIEDSFQTVSSSLRTTSDGLGIVVGMLSAIHDLPLPMKQRGRNLLEKEEDDADPLSS